MSKAIINKFREENGDEAQYTQLIKDILANGSIEKGRNGITKVLVGNIMYFDLTENKLPLLTTKKVAWKSCLKELLWFIRGQTDNGILQQENVKIWNANASRDFLESRNLSHYRDNDLGPIYGFQWRHFNAEYSDCDSDYANKGVDQLEYVIKELKNTETRSSRRLLISAWNPCQLDEMVLPPCHVLMQFNVTEGNKLSCSLYQRSGDVGLGVPFNIASYSFLTHLLAAHCGLEAKEFIYHLGNAHIYDDHFNSLTEQVQREPLEFPKVKINNTYEDINLYKFDDFVVENYKSHETIKMEMRK
jgi:thymidylate synthase